MGLIVAVIGTAMIASISTSNLASASVRTNDKNPNTDKPSLAGQEASELARCDSGCLGEDDTNKGAMGQHSSDDESGGERTEHPRSGLSRALSDDPQHPSEVIENENVCGENGDNCP